MIDLTFDVNVFINIVTLVIRMPGMALRVPDALVRAWFVLVLLISFVSFWFRFIDAPFPDSF